MSRHWPILIALMLVGGAIAYGIYQRQQLEATAQVVAVIKPLPQVYIAIPDGPAPARTVSAPTPTNATGVAASVASVPFQNSLPTVQVPQLAPVPPVVAGAPLPPISPGTPRGIAFTNFRTSVIQKFGAAPTPGQNGGFSMSVDGVRIEVDAGIDWTLALYNNNPANPAVHSENFKTALNLAIANFALDMTGQPNVGADGKQTLRTQSNTGSRVTMITDPAMGNSITIKPLQRRTPQFVTPQTQGQPPAPPNVIAPQPPQPLRKAPQPVPQPPQKPLTPAAPPKPPTIEQF